MPKFHYVKKTTVESNAAHSIKHEGVDYDHPCRLENCELRHLNIPDEDWDEGDDDA